MAVMQSWFNYKGCPIVYYITLKAKQLLLVFQNLLLLFKLRNGIGHAKYFLNHNWKNNLLPFKVLLMSLTNSFWI